MALLLDPPLLPDPDAARGELRQELLHPEYYDKSVVQRLLDWLGRQIDRTVDGAGGTSPLVWLAITLVVLALVAAVVLLASRARRTARQRVTRTGVLTDRGVTAAELRARAEAALAEGRHDDAVVDGYRALARGQVERGRLDDVPGATAVELARALATTFPDAAAALVEAAASFDDVLYGHRMATREQAVAVLRVDDSLRTVRR